MEVTVANLLARGEVNGECIEWVGNRHRQGYGFLWDRDRAKMVLAHRSMYEASNGVTLNRSDYILHSCDNPPCFNIEHLSLGGQSENMTDMLRRGRKPTKLTPAQVADIRAREPGSEAFPELAVEFGVSRSQIQRVVTRKQWTWVA